VTALRALIVDDEPLARDLLRAMLAQLENIEVIGESGDGADAIMKIETTRPDVVFLDIQMPEGSGFDVVRALDPSALPAIVFVTAFDQYALRAFEIHALDYLLKPYDLERLGAAVAHVRAILTTPVNNRDAEKRRMLDLIASVRMETNHAQRLAIKVGERTILQRVDNIDWVEADAKYARIHAGDKTYTIRETMRNIESRLDVSKFMRVSRSAIVNLDRVKEIQPWFKGEYVLLMQSGAKVTTTRSYRAPLVELLEGRK
jgi:two-component system LytT family response regulator